MAEDYDVTDEAMESGDADGSARMTSAPEGNQPKVDPARAALVKKWCGKVRRAKEHDKIKGAFKRMKECMELATRGATKEWLDGENYVVPIINRHINQAVSQLYAKNPKTIAERRRRLMYTIWDEKPESLQQALVAMQTFHQVAAQDPIIAQAAAQGQLPQEVMDASALLQEVQEAKAHNDMVDKIAATLEVLWSYYMDEQAHGYKEQLKAVVRRTKVCGVGYIKLGFQRMLEKNPEVTARIEDVTAKIKRTESLLQQVSRNEIEDEAAEMEELRLNLQDLQQQEMMVVREGPVLDFPRSREIIIDPNCRHLKTLAGAEWIAHEFDMHPDEIEEIYGKDIGKGYTELKTDNRTMKGDDGDTKGKARVWEVQDKRNRQCFTICDGYHDFLKAPQDPYVPIERFFTVFPVVFNEIESEDELFPPSDVWLARDTQNEYNRSRQGLREHRIANRPYYAVEKGKLERSDKEKLANHAAHEVIEVNALIGGQKIDDVLQRGPNVPIDPNQYEVEMLFNDMLRTVGSQEANLGGTSGSTATETTVAETSRLSSRDDNVDDLDDVMTNLARAGGQLMLLTLTKDTVLEIAGPGAVWPDAPQTRDEVSKELFLTIKAGSSGRPNVSMELANLERAMPHLLQIPGINPATLADKYTTLLDVDVADLIVEGLPSITAMNAMAGKPAQSPSSEPGAQGQSGGGNAPQPAQTPQGPQPSFQTEQPLT